MAENDNFTEEKEEIKEEVTNEERKENEEKSELQKKQIELDELDDRYKRVFAEFENGKIFTEQFYNSEYGHAFAKFARPGCYSCNFRGENHKSDITVCDFWGLEKNMPGYNPDGVSALLVRSEKGRELINLIDREKFQLDDADADNIFRMDRFLWCRIFFQAA